LLKWGKVRENLIENIKKCGEICEKSSKAL